MKKLLQTALGLGLIMTTITACNQSLSNDKYQGYEKIEDNLYAKYYIDNDTGRVVQVNDIVTMELMYTTENDSVLVDTREMGEDAQLQVTESAYKGDILGAFVGMNVGDSASFIVSADSFFLRTAQMPELPPFIDSASVLHFTVKIKSVATQEELMAKMQQENQEAEMNEAMSRMDYLRKNNIVVEPTESGLIFISTEEGTGKAAENGKVVKVNYSGRLLDGTYFDTSIEEVAHENGLYNPQRPYEPIEFTLGQRQVIPGWEEGILMLKEGGKAQLIIPSDLAYGPNGQGGIIKPFSTLIFDVELVEVK